MAIFRFLSSSKDGYYFDNKYASVKWVPEIGVAVIKWKKRVEGDNYRKVCYRALELLEMNRAIRWYENRAALGELGAEDTHWFETEFYDKLLKLGIIRHAILLSSKAFNAAKYEDWLYKMNEDGVERRYFGDKKEAVTWLSRPVVLPKD